MGSNFILNSLSSKNTAEEAANDTPSMPFVIPLLSSLMRVGVLLLLKTLVLSTFYSTQSSSNNSSTHEQLIKSVLALYKSTRAATCLFLSSRDGATCGSYCSKQEALGAMPCSSGAILVLNFQIKTIKIDTISLGRLKKKKMVSA